MTRRTLIQLLLFMQTIRSRARIFLEREIVDPLYLACDATEVSGLTNGSLVNPTATTFAAPGTLVVAGTGAASFGAGVVGNGVKFLQGGQQNTNVAYYKWTGASVGDVFAAETGEIHFYLTSSYSWAARQALTPNRLRYVYEVYDGTGRQFVFLVNVFEGSPNRLKVTWGQNAYGTEYDIPAGQEDTLFGSGVTSHWRITWDGTNHAGDSAIAHLYLNGILVQSLPYTYAAPNWTSGSVAIIGAQASPEGYFTCDDQIDEFYTFREIQDSTTYLSALNDFEFGSNGDLVTASALNVSEQGVKWSWSQDRTPLGHTRVNTSNTNFTLPTSVGDRTVITTGSRGLKFDLDEAVSDNLTPIFDVISATPPAGDLRRCVVTGFITFGTTGASFHSMDTIQVGGTPLVTLQLNINGAGTEGTGGEVHIETQVGGGTTYKSSSIPVEINTVYHYELLYDSIDGHMALIIRSADQSTLIGTSGKITDDAGDANLSYIRIQSYLSFEAGYLAHDKFGRAWGPSVPFPLYPLTVPTPATVTLVQESSSNLSLRWASRALAFTIERSSNGGSSWTTLYTAEEAPSFLRLSFPTYLFTDDTVVDGSTYRYRITAHIGSADSSATTSADVTVDNGVAPVASDDFNSRSDASSLGDAGSSSDWEALTGSGPAISNTGDGGFFGGAPNFARYIGVAFTSNQRAEITLRTLDPGSFSLRGVIVRGQSAAATCYAFFTDGTNWLLWRYSAGTNTSIASGTHSLSAGAKVALSATGAGASTRLTVQIDSGSGWTNLSGATNIDPGAYLDGGSPGVISYSGSSSVLGDDFKGYNL